MAVFREEMFKLRGEIRTQRDEDRQKRVYQIEESSSRVDDISMKCDADLIVPEDDPSLLSRTPSPILPKPIITTTQEVEIRIENAMENITIKPPAEQQQYLSSSSSSVPLASRLDYITRYVLLDVRIL